MKGKSVLYRINLYDFSMIDITADESEGILN